MDIELYKHFQNMILGKIEKCKNIGNSLTKEESEPILLLFKDTFFEFNKFNEIIFYDSIYYFRGNVKFIYNRHNDIEYVCSINPFYLTVLYPPKSNILIYKIEGKKFFDSFRDINLNKIDWDQRFEDILYRYI